MYYKIDIKDEGRLDKNGTNEKKIFIIKKHQNIGGINYEEKNCNGDIGNLFIWNFSRL